MKDLHEVEKELLGMVITMMMTITMTSLPNPAGLQGLGLQGRMVGLQVI